jgi:EAL domain-containing protein (putative c-di-GMP-specific phosphodiesterase class I)
MEALVRWDHPELGVVSPADFIPVAEDTGLILPLGEVILRRACETVVRLSTAGYSDVVCAVNLSAAQFRDQALPARVAAILGETGAAPAQLQLELTESLVMQDDKHGLETLHSLRDLGLSLAIDDFGTGHSSLSYLTRLPVETVKIDQSFVRAMQPGSDEALIVEAVVALAHSLRLTVVAEGVERQDQLDHLRRLGCDEVQGYLLGKPMREAEFTAWLQANPGNVSAPRLATAI